MDESSTGDKTSYAKEAAGGDAKTNREAEEKTGDKDAGDEKSDERTEESEKQEEGTDDAKEAQKKGGQVCFTLPTDFYHRNSSLILLVRLQKGGKATQEKNGNAKEQKEGDEEEKEDAAVADKDEDKDAEMENGEEGADNDDKSAKDRQSEGGKKGAAKVRYCIRSLLLKEGVSDALHLQTNAKRGTKTAPQKRAAPAEGTRRNPSRGAANKKKVTDDDDEFDEEEVDDDDEADFDEDDDEPEAKKKQRAGGRVRRVSLAWTSSIDPWLTPFP